jgi:hypothetical protein
VCALALSRTRAARTQTTAPWGETSHGVPTEVWRFGSSPLYLPAIIGRMDELVDSGAQRCHARCLAPAHARCHQPRVGMCVIGNVSHRSWACTTWSIGGRGPADCRQQTPRKAPWTAHRGQIEMGGAGWTTYRPTTLCRLPYQVLRATVRNGHNLKMANRVRVAVRLRPLNDREVNKGACECIEVEGDRYVALPRGHFFGVRLPSLRQ